METERRKLQVIATSLIIFIAIVLCHFACGCGGGVPITDDPPDGPAPVKSFEGSWRLTSSSTLPEDWPISFKVYIRDSGSGGIMELPANVADLFDAATEGQVLDEMRFIRRDYPVILGKTVYVSQDTFAGDSKPYLYGQFDYTPSGAADAVVFTVPERPFAGDNVLTIRYTAEWLSSW